MPDITGKTLGKYQVVERLGRGGMAEVYRAFQPTMNRFVAIKVMLSHLADEEGFTERFKREASSVGALRHPNIVQVFDFDIHDDQYFMVMEYIQGESLKDRLKKRGALPIPETLDIAIKLTDALAYAHHEGMLHRDIKPANILFTKTGEPVLTDFGVAKIMGKTQMTASGALVGTPAYMSPEAGRGGAIDGRTDIYSVGIVLYEMLSGNIPYDADTPLAIIFKHISEPLPLLRNLPPTIESILLRCLAKEPDDRFPTAGDLRDALIEARAGYATEAPTKTGSYTPPPAITRTPSTPTRPPAATMPQDTVRIDESAAQSKRNLIVPVFLGVVVVGLVGIIVALLATRGSGGGGAATGTAISADMSPTIPMLPGPTLTPTSMMAAALQETPTVMLAPMATQVGLPAPTVVSDAALSASPTPPNTPVATETAIPTLTPTEVAMIEIMPGYFELRDQILEKVRNGQLDDALAVIEPMLAQDPERYELLTLRAYVLIRYRENRDRLEAGRQDAEKAISIAPQRPEAYAVLGGYYLGSPIDDAVTAEKYFTDAIDRGIDSAEVFYLRSRIRFNQGDDAEIVLSDINRAIELTPKDAYLYEQRADFFMRWGRWAESEESYWQALDLYPRPAYGLHRPLGFVLLKQDERQEAFNLYAEGIIVEHNTDSGYYADAATVALYGGRLDEAQAWSDTALVFEPTNVRALYVRALIASQRGETEAALAVLETAISLKQDYQYPYLNIQFDHELNLDRARLLVKLERYDEAIEAYGAAIEAEYWARPSLERALVFRFLKRFDEAREDLRRALEINRQRPNAQERARIEEVLTELRSDKPLTELLSSEPQPTISAFEPPSEETPEPTPIVIAQVPPEQIALNQVDERYRELKAQVINALRDGSWENAYTQVEQALRADPQSYDLLVLMAQTLMWRDNEPSTLVAAKTVITQAIQINPARADAYHYLGDYYDRTRNEYRYQACLNFREAIDKGTQIGAAYVQWAHCVHDFEEFGASDELADAYYSRAIELEPNEPEWYVQRGVFRFEHYRYADAIPDLEQAIALYPQTYLHGRLAVAYFNTEQGPKAFELYRQQIEVNNETDPNYLIDGVYVARYVEQDETAQKWFAIVEGLDPENPKVIYMKALFAWDSGEYEQALDLLQRLVEVERWRYDTPFLNPGLDRYVPLDLGRILVLLGELHEAVPFFVQAFEENRWWAQVMIELAEVHIQRGDLTAAGAALNEALYANSQYEWEEERIRILDLITKVSELSRVTPTLTPTPGS